MPELVEKDGKLYLTDGKLEMCADFSDMKKRLKQGNLEHEMLVKAVRIKGAEGPIRVLDATAGLGQDSIILAAAGFYVRLYEYDSVIAALLKDGLRRAALDEELEKVVSRMSFVEGDSIEAMKRMAPTKADEQEGVLALNQIEPEEKSEAVEYGQENDDRPDVILLDPMFPERQKSALIKKKFQLLQQLERPCGNEEELLAAAFAAKPKKIVIKRPAKGPFLAGVKPDYSLEGKAVRYDCILVK